MVAVQKVLHFSEFKKRKKFSISNPYAVMEKLDGWYVYIDYIEGKWGNLRSSSERIIPSLNDLTTKLSKIKLPLNPTRFIFEATIKNMLFHELNGVLNRKYEQAENVVLNLHDMIPLTALNTSFFDRITDMRLNLPYLEDSLENQVSQIEILGISDKEEVFTHYFNSIIAKDGEGVILKNINAGYSPGKRNTDMMKIKEEVSEEAKVTGIIKGEGKYAYTTGALECKLSNGVTIYISGMSDYERDLWWEFPTKIIGQIVEVKAMKALPDGTLREPRFKCIRYNKG